jgi:hypothetical protein
MAVALNLISLIIQETLGVSTCDRRRRSFEMLRKRKDGRYRAVLAAVRRLRSEVEGPSLFVTKITESAGFCR